MTYVELRILMDKAGFTFEYVPTLGYSCLFNKEGRIIYRDISAICSIETLASFVPKS